MYSKCAQKNECSHKILNLCQIHEMHAPASLVVAILCLLVTFWKPQHVYLEVKWRKQWWSRSINTNNKESKYSFMWDSHCGTSLNIKVNMKKTKQKHFELQSSKRWKKSREEKLTELKTINKTDQVWKSCMWFDTVTHLIHFSQLLITGFLRNKLFIM